MPTSTFHPCLLSCNCFDIKIFLTFPSPDGKWPDAGKSGLGVASVAAFHFPMSKRTFVSLFSLWRNHEACMGLSHAGPRSFSLASDGAGAGECRGGAAQRVGPRPDRQRDHEGVGCAAQS